MSAGIQSYSPRVEHEKPILGGTPQNSPRVGGTPKGKTKVKLQKLSLSDFLGVEKTLTNSADLKAVTKTKVVRWDPNALFEDYNGEIDPRYSRAQYVLIKDVVNKLLFSQTNVSDFNKEETRDVLISELADSLFVEFRLGAEEEGALDIVDNRDGTFTSLDNRRLILAYKIGAKDRLYGIWVKVHRYDERLSKSEQRRFSGAYTWGEAALRRVNGNISNSNSNSNSNANVRVNGFAKLPKILDMGKEKSCQGVELTIDPDNYDYSVLNQEDLENLLKNRKNGTVTI